MSFEQDSTVALDQTLVSPLEDTVKIKNVYRERGINWKEQNNIFQQQIGQQSILKLAEAWGVSQESLRRIGIGFDTSTSAYTFPMKNWQGDVVGIRKRSFKEIHQKYAAKDSTQGLFIPEGVTPGNLQIISEGESDVAAALSADFQAIGVPGTGAVIDDVIGFAVQSPVACPCIIGDNDAAGENGAEKLANSLLAADIPCRVLIPPEPYSDMRDWVSKGHLTSDTLAKATTEQKIRYPNKWPSNFFMVPNALIRRGVIKQVGPAAFAILTTITSFSDSQGVCRVGRTKLSELTGISERTIDRHNKILKKMGLLSWKPGRTERANEYRFNFGPCKGSNRKYVVRPVRTMDKKNLQKTSRKTLVDS